MLPPNECEINDISPMSSEWAKVDEHQSGYPLINEDIH